MEVAQSVNITYREVLHRDVDKLTELLKKLPIEVSPFKTDRASLTLSGAGGMIFTLRPESGTVQYEGLAKINDELFDLSYFAGADTEESDLPVVSIREMASGLRLELYGHKKPSSKDS